MSRPLVCLTVTGKTLAEDVRIVEQYKNYIDMVELRVDYLVDEEKYFIGKFPSMIDLPCILTIRRQIDGGNFSDGEANRTILFARAMAFVNEDMNKNYAYVDFEDDYRVSSLQDAAIAYNIKIIRSIHDFKNPVHDISERVSRMQTASFEIPKIAFMPRSLDDVTNLFNESKKLKDNNHILLAMGPLGAPSRILASYLNNYLTFTSPREIDASIAGIGHLDAITLNETYHIRDISRSSSLYGITGWPLSATSSPALHNEGYRKHDIDAVYVPCRSEKFSQVMDFAESVGMKGFSVTVPHKEAVAEFMDYVDPVAKDIGACNTVVRDCGKWYGYNTDVTGFTKSLLEFLDCRDLRFKKVSIIGAGGAARAIAYAVKKLHGKACVFNRTVKKAQELSELYGFEYASLSEESLPVLKKYSNLIIQTTSKGMNSTEESDETNDPIYFYDFTGKEKVFDIIYVPEETPVMVRAKKAGCKVCNGYEMLKYQGYEQFELFTKVKY